MTNWTTEQLGNLKNVTNHKVVYDGYEFVWMSKPNNTWMRHCVSNFKDYNKPMSWIHHHTYNWGKEYRQRHDRYLQDMRKSLDIDIKIREISREAKVKTKEKVREIINLKPTISSKEIADILDITPRAVNKHRM
jgi:hypothetical protein|tara:strand:+ start:30 stop:431 length:402 start_codon:yes stop_codon:yes gene_type:complete